VNQLLYNQSAFSVFFIATADTPAARIASGFVSQRLCNAATAMNIGVCPIGGLSDINAIARATNTSDQVLLHSILAGRLAQGQDTPSIPIKKEIQLLSQDKGKHNYFFVDIYQ
jgi:hypothetical protein